MNFWTWARSLFEVLKAEMNMNKYPQERMTSMDQKSPRYIEMYRDFWAPSFLQEMYWSLKAVELPK